VKLLWLLLPFALLAKEITLEWLQTKPTSTAKDYYIWRYLHQNPTPSEALQALQQAKNVNRKLFFAYANRAEPQIKRIAECMKLGAKELLQADASCAAAGMNSYKLSTLSKKEIAHFLQKTKHFKTPKIYRLYLKKSVTPKEFVRLFNASSKSYRIKLDRYLSANDLKAIDKNYAFKSFVKRVALSEDYPKLATSLLLTPSEEVKGESAFYLALIALKRNLPYTAIDYFKKARKSYYQFDIDKANYWLYRLTGKKEFLERVLHSWDLNLYTILAREERDLPIEYEVLEAKGQREDVNLSDPFIWETLLKQNLKKEDFYYENTLAVYAYLAEKESKYRLHPFILPYKKLLKDSNATRKALIYAIARQESRFIPGSVSRSYALGLMQFMPFLAKHTAKKLSVKNFDLDMMFEPKIALLFAHDHLDYLETNLHHPLLIAYAYNGGIGFTKRLVLPLFNRYDTLLAMELVPYSESREYGKKVLANYYVYKKILKEPFSIRRSLEKLGESLQYLDGKK
jgi:soluble lytic murein transglycosylase